MCLGYMLGSSQYIVGPCNKLYNTSVIFTCIVFNSICWFVYNSTSGWLLQELPYPKTQVQSQIQLLVTTNYDLILGLLRLCVCCWLPNTQLLAFVRSFVEHLSIEILKYCYSVKLIVQITIHCNRILLIQYVFANL